MFATTSKRSLGRSSGRFSGRFSKGFSKRSSNRFLGRSPDLSPVLAFGSEGDAVKVLQHALTVKFHPAIDLEEDGYFGAQTLAAVKYMQCVVGLSVDGVVGDLTQAFLEWGVDALPVLSLGSTGPAVVVVQQVLNQEGAMPGSPLKGLELMLDGLYHQQTQQAVKTFQRRFNLLPDGIVGAKTWGHMMPLRLMSPTCSALLETETV